MSLADEKQGFSRRLQECLRRIKAGGGGPTGIAREFNLRYQGAPVSAQAVRKWLLGESLPSQDKIRTLAAWLETTPHWLRFGEGESGAKRAHAPLKQESAAYHVNSAWLAARFDTLNDAHQKMVVEVVLGLLRLEGKA